jgi:serine/threonine protein kinase
MVIPFEEKCHQWRSLSIHELVKHIQLDQDARWQQAAGVLVEEYLRSFPSLAENEDTILALILNEVYLREGQGQKILRKEYHDRFPMLSHRLEMHLHHHSMCSKAIPEAEEETGTYALQTAEEDKQPSGISGIPVDQSRKVGRFILRHELGQGSFGIVYQAYDPTLERDVALKVPKRTDQQQMVERFVREAKAAARLQHPNIVTVFDCSAEPGQSFIAMEWVEGVPLHKHVERYRPNQQQVGKWLRDLALALHTAHEQGILHRDVKPANIMVDKQSRVRLMDFGLAKKRQTSVVQNTAEEVGAENTREGALVGTPAYMSPEQASGQTELVSFASDQFSLGVVGYELLTEKRPVTGKLDQLPEKLRDPQNSIKPPRELDKSIPTGLEAILMKALQWEPDKRYSSLAEMALDLHRWLKGDEVQAPIHKGKKNWKCPSCQRLNAKSKLRCVYCKHHQSGGVPVDWTEQSVIPMESRRIRHEDYEPEARFRVHWWEWFILSICLLILVLIPSLQRADRQALETGRLFFGMREVEFAMQNYAQTFGHYPNNIVDKISKEPLLSWRVSILPFLEQEKLYQKFHLDEPWDSEHNKTLIAEMPEIFDPSLSATWWFRGAGEEKYTTPIQGFAGKGALFEPNKKIRAPDISDGHSNTLALAQARRWVTWTKPEDMAFTEKELPELGQPGTEQFLGTMMDGSTLQLNPELETDKLLALITRAGGEFVKLDDVASKNHIRLSPIFWRKNSEGEPNRALTKFPSHRPRHWSEFSGWLNYWTIETGEKIWLGTLIVLVLLILKLVLVWNFYRRQAHSSR